MSCQQASRFITTTGTTTTTVATAKSAVTKRIAAAAATAKLATLTTTPVAHTLDVESFAVAAAKTNALEDPYVFTETIAATPPILFNAQKSRARLSEAQHSRNSNNNSVNINNNKQTVANKKSSIVAATSVPIAQFNGNATAIATASAAATTNTTAATSVATARPAPAITKAQASLGTTTTTTNFNNVPQSQRQPTSQPQLQLQSTLQLQSQASTKRATNVCVVRPQQQHQQLQQQQQQQLKQQQAKLITRHPVPKPPPPPPLYTHTPSLWQTPLILDTTQKQQQSNLVVTTTLVSPPTSPASLPSPTVNTPPTAAVTAMVSPIVLPPAAAPAAMSPPKGCGSLPPSKFHHTTLAQHLQKVECLKKKKSLPLACQNSNNNNIAESLHCKTTTLPFAGYNLTHPPPLTVFNTTVAAAASPMAAVAKQKHSTDALDDTNDLNEIPVNVIFRKPPVLLAGAAAQTPPRPANGKSKTQSAVMKLGAVAPQTQPTPPPHSAPVLGNVCTQLPTAVSAVSATVPALITKSAMLTTTATATGLATAAPAALIASTQTEHMSSKVANSVVSQAATPKRKTQAASAGCRKGNKANIKSAAVEPPLPVAQQPQDASQPPEPTSVNRIARRRKAAPAAKRITELFSENEPLLPDVPYCLQKYWLHADSSSLVLDREERIAVRKGMLRRQALQLLSTHPLQSPPMRAARKRLQCVQRLLLKYQDHANQQQAIGVGNRCLVAGCKEPTLSMAAHCASHIVNNSTQQVFQPCVAWRVDGTACQAPVFDVLHVLALCPAHSHLRQGLEQQSKRQQQPQQEKVSPQLSKPAHTPTPPGTVPSLAGATAAVAGKRKRKTNPNANPVGRPQKRAKKQPDSSAPATLPVVMSMTTLPPMSAVLQRKSSTTSLESIASNSQSSAKSHSALQPYTPTAPVLTMPQLSIIPPALAPLSDYQLQQQLPKIELEQPPLDASVNLLANANFKPDEISQIVAQLAAASGELHNSNNNNNHLHYNNNNHNNHNNVSYCSNNNSNSGSSSISCGFPSFNAAFGQQATPRHVNTTLASTESMLSQHMFGICENSSAYASSEDTGLGGLSESELIGANDADDIALNGAHLLEEHDLVNVFDTLPDDAFNELFQSVQQAECEAMDRALEMADKNLKCLQQTIGSTEHDSAFLNDFLDVGDDLLVNAVSSVMNSPTTSGIDASTLFVDSSSGGGNSSSNGAIGSSSNGCIPTASVADIRGLVQT